MPDMEQEFSRQAELVMAHWMSVSPDTTGCFACSTWLRDKGPRRCSIGTACRG